MTADIVSIEFRDQNGNTAASTEYSYGHKYKYECRYDPRYLKIMEDSGSYSSGKNAVLNYVGGALYGKDGKIPAGEYDVVLNFSSNTSYTYEKLVEVSGDKIPVIEQVEYVNDYDSTGDYVYIKLSTSSPIDPARLTYSFEQNEIAVGVKYVGYKEVNRGVVVKLKKENWNRAVYSCRVRVSGSKGYDVIGCSSNRLYDNNYTFMQYNGIANRLEFRVSGNDVSGMAAYTLFEGNINQGTVIMKGKMAVKNGFNILELKKADGSAIKLNTGSYQVQLQYGEYRTIYMSFSVYETNSTRLTSASCGKNHEYPIYVKVYRLYDTQCIVKKTVKNDSMGTSYKFTNAFIEKLPDADGLYDIAVVDSKNTIITTYWSRGLGVGDETTDDSEDIDKVETPDEPSDPSGPTNPSDPDDPSNPTDPSNPSDPSNPTDPSNPGDPSDPSSPASPSEPTDPSDPTNPSEPDNPSDPTNPEPPKQIIHIKDHDPKLNITIPSMFFNNKAQNVKPSVFYDGERLIEGIDYTVEYLDDRESVGEHKLKMVFMEGYSGECIGTYVIYRRNTGEIKDISKVKFNLDKDAVKNAYYTGSAVKPTVTGEGVTENSDYVVVYKNNYNVGKATVTIIGLHNEETQTTYVNTKTLYFNIKKVNLKNNVTSNAYKSDYDYVGEPVTLDDLVLKLNNGSNKEPYTLKKGTDYTVSYGNNSKAGTATATIKGIGNFTGSARYNFKIKPLSLANIPDSAVTKLEYSPKGAKLKTITYSNVTLKEGTDYTAKYTYSDKKTKAVGTTVTVELTGKNACKGTSRKFENIPITAANFANCIVKPSDLVIDAAKTNKRAVKIMDYAGVNLKADKQYSLTWDSNEKTDGTTLTLTVTPKDTKNYSGSKTVNYRIAKNIAKEKNITVKDKIYDGRYAVQIKASDISGLNAKDYKIIGYKNNAKAGRAQVIIEGVGQYYGTKALTFKITTD